MRISDKLQLGFITAGNTIRITCTNTYVKPKTKAPKIKVNLFDTDGVKVENPENMERSLRRARVSVVDYALTNRFDYFGTITINGKWHDVSNPLACRNAILGKNGKKNTKKGYGKNAVTLYLYGAEKRI